MSQIHPLARTTPRTRTEIRCSTDTTSKLAKRYNISKATVRKWKSRDDALDRSHRAHNLGTTLSPAQELIVLEIRRVCLLPLDDLLSITRRFINANASRLHEQSCANPKSLSLMNRPAKSTWPARFKSEKRFRP